MKKIDTVLAYNIAKKAHSGQYRRDKKTPFLEHPKAVAKYIANYMSNDKNRDLLVSAALLHDVIEDTKVTYADLVDTGISMEVIALVTLLTKYPSEKYIDYLKRICLNENAKIIKIADIKHNLSTLEPSKNTLRDKYELALWILEEMYK